MIAIFGSKNARFSILWCGSPPSHCAEEAHHLKITMLDNVVAQLRTTIVPSWASRAWFRASFCTVTMASRKRHAQSPTYFHYFQDDPHKCAAGGTKKPTSIWINNTTSGRENIRHKCEYSHHHKCGRKCVSYDKLCTLRACYPLCSRVLMLKPSVGEMVLTSSPLNFFRIVVFPALSRPLRGPD